MKKLLLPILSFWITFAFAQDPILDNHFWQPDGPVNVIEYDSVRNQVFLGGEFTSVAPRITNNAFLSPQDGIPDARFPGVYYGNIMSSCDDGNGGWYIGGNFTQVGDSLRNRIAHISSSGAVLGDFSGEGFNYSVKKIARSNDTLIVAGDFNAFGTPVKDVIYLDLNNYEINPSFPLIDGYVSVIKGDGNGGWYIGGSFDSVGDSVRKNLVHVDSSMTVTAWSPSLDYGVQDIVIKGDSLIICGAFTEINGQPRSYIAGLDVITGNLLPWNPIVNGWIEKLAIHNDNLYLLGTFTLVNGVGPPNFSAVNLNTGTNLNLPYTTFNPFENGRCDIKISGDTAFIGGYFENFGGVTNRNIAAFDLVNQVAVNWLPTGVDSTVKSIAIVGNQVVMGGLFYHVHFVNKTTGVPTGLSPGISALSGGVYKLEATGDTVFAAIYNYSPDGPLVAINANNYSAIDIEVPAVGGVYTMAVQNDKLLASGTLNGIIGSKCKRIAELNSASSQILPVLLPDANDAVNDLIIDGDQIILGGEFSKLGDSLRYKIGIIDRFTGAVTPWKSQQFLYSFAVNKLLHSDSIIYAGGNFTYNLNGTTKGHLVAMNRVTGNIFNWSPSANYTVSGMCSSGDHLYISGGFDSVAGVNRNGIAALNKYTGTIENLNLDPDSYVLDISVNKNILYIAGNFDTISGTPRSKLAAYDLLAQQFTSWNPDPEVSGSVYSVFGYDSKVIVSGGFSKIGRKYRKNLVSLNVVSGMPTDLDIQPDGRVTSLARHSNHLFIGGEFNNVNALPRTSFAEIDLDSNTVTTLDAGLANVLDIQALQVAGDNLYAGGWFNTFMGQPRPKLASYNLTTGSLNPFSIPAINPIYDLAVDGDTLYVGGSFQINNTPVGNLQGLCAVNISSGSFTNMNLNPVMPGASVYAILPVGDSVYVGGDFDNIGSQPRGNLAVFDIISGTIGSWYPDTLSDPYVQTLAAWDSLIFVGGSFSNFQYPVAHGPLVVVNKYTGLLSSWRPQFAGTISNLKMNKSQLFIGGNMNYNSIPWIYPGENFLVFNLQQGPEIIAPADIVTCFTDTIGPLQVELYDSLDVNSVILEASSSDTSLIANNQIVISGTGSLRYLTVVPVPGAYGTCTIYLSATNQQGVSSYSSFIITLGTPVVVVAGNSSFCIGDSTTLTAGTGFSSYQWSNGNNTPTIQVNQPGNYTVTATTLSGCTSEETVLVSVNPLPVVSITATPSIEICLGDSTLLSATPGYMGYQWLKYNIIIPGATTDSYYAKSTGGYRCSVTDTNSCQKTSNNLRVRIICFPPDPPNEKIADTGIASLEVSVLPNPSSGDFTIITNCSGDQVFSVEVYDASQRLLQKGTSEINRNTFTISKLSAGIYYAKVKCGNEQQKVKLVQVE